MLYYTGLVLFFGIHLVPLIPPLREKIVASIGRGPYLGMFSLVSLVGLLLIIAGFDTSNRESTREPAELVANYGFVLLIPAFIFLASSQFPGYIKLYSRHPMTLGIALWGTAHLLTGASLNSTILFSGFVIYSIVSAISSEMRGAVKPTKRAPNWVYDGVAVLAGVAVYLLAYRFHYYLAGVSLMPEAG